MKHVFKYAFFSVMMSLFVIQCTKDKAPVIMEPPAQAGDSCSTNITYSKKIAPIINSTYALPGCHVPSGFKDFSTYTALKSEIDARGSPIFFPGLDREAACLLLTHLDPRAFLLVNTTKLKHGLTRAIRKTDYSKSKTKIQS